MKKAKTFTRDGIILAALGWAVFTLSGCEPSSSDDKAPEVTINLSKTQGKYRFGVTDTVIVSFSENIDTGALVVGISPASGITHKFSGRTRLLIYGDTVTYGVHRFPIGASFELTLGTIKDLKGNSHDPVDELFLSRPWLDLDFVNPAFNSYDSLYRNDSTWADGSSYRDSMISEGSLDFKQTTGASDYQDYKIVLLTPPDTLLTTLTCSRGVNLKLQAAGPFAPDSFATTWSARYFATVFDSSQTGAAGKAALKFNADFDRHDSLLNDASAPGIYVIRVVIPLDQEGFYRLGLAVHVRK